MSADRQSVGVADLRIDAENPRHPKAANDRDAIQALLRDDGGKLVRLAASIAKHGLNPTDVFLVLKERGGIYTVLEGNRRMAALKLLANPGIADEPRYRDRFREIAKGMTPIHEVMCAIVEDRKDAKYWQELRHTGQREGVGVVDWNAEAIARFHSRRRPRADRALAFIDAVAESYPANTTLQTDLKRLRQNRFTNLTRFIDDPAVRNRFGFEFSDGKATWFYDSDVLEPAIERIVGDLAGPVAVGDIFNRQKRAEYLKAIADDLPDETQRKQSAASLTASKARRRRSRKARPSPPARLFDEVKLASFGGRVEAILAELNALNPEGFPNSAAVLIRVLLELTTTGVCEARGWQVLSLQKNVRKCLNAIDPAGDDDRFEPVRRGLNDPNSMMSAQTIQKWVHNKFFHPVPADVRAWAANNSPFLSALDELLRTHKP